MNPRPFLHLHPHPLPYRSIFRVRRPYKRQAFQSFPFPLPYPSLCLPYLELANFGEHAPHKAQMEHVAADAAKRKQHPRPAVPETFVGL